MHSQGRSQLPSNNQGVPINAQLPGYSPYANQTPVATYQYNEPINKSSNNVQNGQSTVSHINNHAGNNNNYPYTSQHQQPQSPQQSPQQQMQSQPQSQQQQQYQQHYHQQQYQQHQQQHKSQATSGPTQNVAHMQSMNAPSNAVYNDNRSMSDQVPNATGNSMPNYHQQYNYMPNQPMSNQYAQNPYTQVYNAAGANSYAQAPHAYEQHANNYGPMSANAQSVDQITQNMSRVTLTRGFNQMFGNEGVNLLSERHIKSRVNSVRSAFGDHTLIRSTLAKIPESASLLQKCRLPFGIVCHPFREQEVPIIQDRTIVRCRTCRTYINPHVRLLEQKRWQCNFCHRLNDFPDDFMHDPRSKQYIDHPFSQPELSFNTIEFVASDDYMVRLPQAAAYLYVFDCSVHALALGYVPVMAKVILENLENIPGDTRTLIGFIGFDSNIHFFNLGDDQPVHMVVPDIADAFIPNPENLLVNLTKKCENVEQFLTQILPNLPQESATDSGSALGSAISIAYKLLAPLGGRITLFQSTLPNLGGNDGSVLKNREDPNNRAVSGTSTDGLTTLLNPISDFYKKLGLKCSENHVGIDLFNLCPTYSDLASVAPVAKISSGSIFYYGNSGFNIRCSPGKVLARFEADFERYLCRDIGFEAVMRIRCTRGLSFHTFHGNFFVRSMDLLSLANCNPDAGYAIQLSIDEELKDFSHAGFQVAILYTNATGERRIRVSNISLPVVSTITEVMTSADQEAVIALLCRMASERTLTDNLGHAREALINCAVDILQTYKRLNPLDSVNGLVATEATALIPLYVSALLKQMAFRVGISTKIDDRFYALERMKTLPLCYLLTYIYPNLYRVDIDFDYENQHWPTPLQLSFGSIERSGAYLLDTHDTMVLYVCKGVSVDFIQDVFAVDHFAQIPDDGDLFPADLNANTKPGQSLDIPKPSAVIPIENYDNAASNRVNALVYSLLNNRPFKPHFFIIREDSRAKYVFLQYMFDDRSESAFSYFEFLQHIQQQIKI